MTEKIKNQYLPSQKQQTIPHSSYYLHMAFISILHIVVTVCSATLLPSYSYQNKLWPSVNPQISAFAQFDSMHFMMNEYSHEQNFAFLPAYTWICRIILQMLGHNYQNAIISLVLINKILIWLSIGDLINICKTCKLSKQSIHKVVLLFIYNPALVFFHSPYSQSLYIFLTFKAISYLFTRHNSIVFTLLLMIATLVRSTGIFLLPVIGIPLIIAMFESLRQKKLIKALGMCIYGAIILLIVMVPFVGYLWWSFKMICHEKSLQICSSTLPNIYSWVQAKYWNVGALAYYSQQNIIFIVIGLPSIIFSLMFIKFPKQQSLGLHISFIFLLMITLIFTNIQSSTRFLCSHPAFYINAILSLRSMDQKYKTPIQFIFKSWSLGMCLCGMILFAIGFPWT